MLSVEKQRAAQEAICTMGQALAEVRVTPQDQD